MSSEVEGGFGDTITIECYDNIQVASTQATHQINPTRRRSIEKRKLTGDGMTMTLTLIALQYLFP